MSAPPTAPAPRPTEPAAVRLERIAAEQGVLGTATLDRLRKNLEALALSDEEQDEFIRHLEAARHVEEAS